MVLDLHYSPYSVSYKYIGKLLDSYHNVWQKNSLYQMDCFNFCFILWYLPVWGLFFFLNDGELDMHDKPSFLQKMNSSLVLIVLTLGLFSSSTAMLVKLFWSWDPFIFLEIIQNSPKSCSSGSPCFRVKLRNV